MFVIRDCCFQTRILALTYCIKHAMVQCSNGGMALNLNWHADGTSTVVHFHYTVRLCRTVSYGLLTIQLVLSAPNCDIAYDTNLYILYK